MRGRRGPSRRGFPPLATFAVEGYHYALVRLRGLAPCATYPYTVVPDGEEVWPDFSPSAKGQ